jgi:xylose dehydrogenase (NAD/NADP)
MPGTVASGLSSSGGSVSEPVRWGVLSTALINRKVLAGARLSPDVEILAVASRDGERAASYAAEHGVPRSMRAYPGAA